MNVGGIVRKPGLVPGTEDEIAVRDYVCLTITIDHDVVDGGPAARFVADLLDTIEGGEGIPSE
jgi:pyruvate/2-oxoglutarate dehydrogenase complex dihydrolipoamide acyltransferase (E2) component